MEKFASEHDKEIQVKKNFCKTVIENGTINYRFNVGDAYMVSARMGDYTIHYRNIVKAEDWKIFIKDEKIWDHKENI